MSRILILLLASLVSISLLGQNLISIEGQLVDTNNNPIPFANISISGTSTGTTTNSNGVFRLMVDSQNTSILSISCIGFKSKQISFNANTDKNKKLSVILDSQTEVIGQIDIVADNNHKQSFTRINPKVISTLPDATGNSIEGIIKTQMGVASNNELSSQYRVRGGNYDENLVYINDIEIYRPLLIRSGQQEGYSIANPDMVSSILFSPGGYNASYGDKMSSVLDIKYRRPTSYSGNAQLSFMGASGMIEGITKNGKLSHITGARYKTNQYLLGSLDTKGDYQPSFGDAQTFLTYRFNPNWSLDGLFYYSNNKYQFKPTSRETTFGTISDVRALTIYFDGQEVDQFETGFGALALTHSPSANNQYKLTASFYKAYEEETYDILGEYYLHEAGEAAGERNPTDPLQNIGVAGFLQHARNDLSSIVANVALKGSHQTNNHLISWETKFQREIFNNFMNEWELNDSADYSLPYSDSKLILSNVYNADISTNSNRISGYAMDQVQLPIANGHLSINAGARLNYWSYNNETTFSPRLNLQYTPAWLKPTDFRLAVGYYYQSPFFKEIRMPNGKLNPNIKSQKSIHLVGGFDYYFPSWNRPFKFTAEAYYKTMENLISYQIDNVRIRYSGENDAKGYAAGLDFKINGEFVKGAESWVSLGILKTEEDLYRDEKITINADNTTSVSNPGYIPRPSDQRINFALFFQDYLPNNPNFKAHLSLLYASGLPFGPPDSPRYKATYRMPSYRRADLGFSMDLTPKRQSSLATRIKKMWIGVEIFNLFDINNTISYYWVSDVGNRQYAVPNYLTSRRLNLQLSVGF